jgi:hypothetical protein
VTTNETAELPLAGRQLALGGTGGALGTRPRNRRIFGRPEPTRSVNPADHRAPARFRDLIEREQIRAVGLDDPAAFAEAFHSATAETVEPWYRTTLATDRHRRGEIEAGIRGATYDPQDPQYQLEKALDAAVPQDPDCLRASLDIRLVLRTPEEVFARPGLRDKTLQLGSGWREAQPPGPTREQLLALASAP